MGLLTGQMTVRRFRVVGEVPDGWRDVFRDRLERFAFAEPPGGVGKEEVEGWVQVHNLLDTDFGDFNRWLYTNYAVFALRTDKKALPAKLFSATLDKRCQAWCAEHSRERCPSSVRTELKEALELEWLTRVLPRVGMTELCWRIDEGYVVVHTTSEATIDRVRKRFHQTFGLRLLPWSPLDWIEDSASLERLVTSSPSIREYDGGEP